MNKTLILGMFTYNDIVSSYQYFYSCFYKNDKYIFTPSLKTSNYINTFISLVNKKYRNKTILGVNFLWYYFVFQFNYWKNIEIEEKDFSNRIIPSFIIGSKAYERYESRDREFDWSLQYNDLYEKYSISQNIFKSILKPPIKSQYININESLYKKRNYNTDKGLNNCLIFTTLYNHKDLLCLSCLYKGDCKKLLKENFPRLYEERGYY